MANSVTFGPELWGKTLTALWAGIKDGKGKTMRSFDLFNLPDAIGEVPCAISFVNAQPVDVDYNQGGVNSAVWNGQTEFHLTNSLAKSGLGYCQQFFAKIIVAATSKFYLTPTASFLLVNRKSLELSVLRYSGDETTDHYGIIAYWQVEENLANKINLVL